MNILISLLVSSISIFASSYLLPGVEIDSFWTALLVAVVLGTLNIFIRPFITILTLPISVITLGLFSFVINALMVILADRFIDSFYVDGFLWALAFSFVVSVTSAFLNAILSKD
jgi:putative membrane protein